MTGDGQQGPPLPTRQIMSQWWRDITFLHWRVEPRTVTPMMPPGVRPDVFDGSAWVGLIPFEMVQAGVGHGPPVPRYGTFPETNVRLYSVDDAGRHGVVFSSLEAPWVPVVAGARLGFNVPYQWAEMSIARDGGIRGAMGEGSQISYRTRRRTPPGRDSPGGRIDVVVGEPVPDPTPLEVFLTARFGLHTSWLGRTLWVPNTHSPWPLRRARPSLVEDTLVTALGLPDLGASTPDSALFSTGVRTVFGLPQRV